MQTNFLLLVFTLNFIICPAVFAQQSTDLLLNRLKHRYQINDIDGIGELIEPLWQRLMGGNAEFDLAQQHLVATAASKFHLCTGEHHRAILPYLVSVQIQEALVSGSSQPLIELPDASFRNKYPPPIFFSEKNKQRFRSESDAAIDQGLLRESELVAKYREGDPDQLDSIENDMLASISAVKASDTPSDRQILLLIESFVAQKDQHWSLAHESLATAIETLRRLDRNDEAERLAVVFRTQFPDSRRLER